MYKTNYYVLFLKPIVIVLGSVNAYKTTHIYALSRVLNKHRNIVYSTTLKKIFAFAKLAVFLIPHSNASILRILIGLDLLFNSVRLPILAYFETIILPLLKRRKTVLVEEYLPGLLVDYIVNGMVHNIMTAIGLALKILYINLLYLFALHGLTRFNLVYLYCDKDMLSKRWIKKGDFTRK